MKSVGRLPFKILLRNCFSTAFFFSQLPFKILLRNCFSTAFLFLKKVTIIISGQRINKPFLPSHPSHKCFVHNLIEIEVSSQQWSTKAMGGL